MRQSFLGKKAKTPTQILNDALQKATKEFNKDKGAGFMATLSTGAQRWINTIGKKSGTQKGVVSALTTSLVKKIETPSQDIRYHKIDLRGGYSGRSLDTNYITPFFKEHFPRIAMKESGWLTRSIEQPHAFTLSPPFPGKIRNIQVKDAFLQILNDVEVNAADSYNYLVALFIALISKKTKIQTLIKKVRVPLTGKEAKIDQIVSSLETHFFSDYKSAGASKLPVIAIHSIYRILLIQLSRYRGKKLLPLKSHVAPDVRAGEIGDVEVVNGKDRFFEALEIKHNIPVTSGIIKDAYKKFRNTSVRRYYLLTTAKPYIDPKEKVSVRQLINEIRNKHGCEVIVNGVIPSFKYYLRLISRPELFLKLYTATLKIDIMKGAEIKEEHLEKWKEILVAIYKPLTKKISKTKKLI